MDSQDHGLNLGVVYAEVQAGIATYRQAKLEQHASHKATDLGVAHVPSAVRSDDPAEHLPVGTYLPRTYVQNLQKVYNFFPVDEHQTGDPARVIKN